MAQIICHATMPPACGSYVFVEVNKVKCKLIVPENSLAAYQSAYQWKEFTFIETAVNTIPTDNNIEIKAVFRLNGFQQNETKPGINIVRTSDGTTKKIMVK